MEFNLLTFIFEIINFFVLLFILKKLLYQPIIKVLTERQLLIRSKIEEANQVQLKAEEIKKEQLDIVQELNNKKKQQLDQIQQEVEKYKSLQWKSLNKELEQEKQKHVAYLENKQKEVSNQIQESAIDAALSFSTKVLSILNDAHLHQRLVELALESLEQLPEEELIHIKENIHEYNKVVITAPQMPEQEQFNQIKKSVEKCLGFSPHFSCDIEPELLAGIQIHLGTKLINCTLSGNLEVFKSLLLKNSKEA